jgi:hypothetical protein
LRPKTGRAHTYQVGVRDGPWSYFASKIPENSRWPFSSLWYPPGMVEKNNFSKPFKSYMYL